MAKTVYDLLDSILKKHGLAGIMLLAIAFMYWESRTYERVNDAVLMKELQEIKNNYVQMRTKLEDINKSVDRLEDRVFFADSKWVYSEDK